MTCPHCGYSQIPTGSRFCPNCGQMAPQVAGNTAYVQVNQKVQKIEGGEVAGVKVDQLRGNVFIGSDLEAQVIQRRNLYILLEKVKRFWVEEVLKPSIHGAVRLDLGKKEEPDAIKHPWNKMLGLPNQSGLLLPLDRRISDIFDHAAGACG